MEAITREEKLLSGQQLEPITRKELFLAKAAGMDVQTPEPITREEIFLSQISGGGGGAEPAVIEPLSVTTNGTYTPPEGVDGYSPVTVSVESSGGDEWEEQFKRAIEGDPNNPVTELPAGLAKINERAFFYTKLSVTSLPDSVTNIGNSAFAHQTDLALASLPAGLTSIGTYAFENCTSLKITSLPAGLKKILVGTFSGCTGLTEITFEGEQDEISAMAFRNCTNLLTINVPWAEGAVKNAPWGATNATINYNYTGG